MTYATVAPFVRLPVLSDELTYAIEPAQLGQVSIGRLVLVPVRGRKIHGIVTGLVKHRPRGVVRLSTISATTPIVLPIELVTLARSVRRWCWQPLGVIVAAIIPPPLRRWTAIPNQDLVPKPSDRRQTSQVIAVVGSPLTRFKHYRQLIDRAIAAGRSVILVFAHHAELLRFTQDYPGTMTRWDAAQSRSTRWQQWQQLASGATPTVVAGVRSAVFAPTPNVGLIIVDAPTARGHKDDQAPHYQTARIARLRSTLSGAHLILGDDIAPLTQPPARLAAYEPATTPIELVASDPAKAQLLQAAAEAWLAALPSTDRCFILVNRLGAGTLRCRTCHRSIRCPVCDGLPTVSGLSLRCGRCGWRSEAPTSCATCGNPVLTLHGSGTETIAARLRELLDEPITVLDHLHPPSAPPNRIVVGTEFALPYLVGSDIDHGLFLGLDLLRQHSSFDASERALRLIQQLRGLCRSVTIETNELGDSWLVAIRSDSLRQLQRRERVDRAAHGYPPFVTLVRLTSSDETALAAIRTMLERPPFGYSVFGPTPTRGQRQAQLILQIPAATVSERIFAPIERAGLLRTVSIDVDPTTDSLG